MPSFVNKVITYFKADTTDLKKKMKGVRGEEKKTLKAQLEAADKRNESLDEQIAKWGKVAAGIGAVTAAVVVARKGFQAYAEDVQARTAAAGVDMDGLKKATHGLVEEERLLAFASAAMNSDFKITQKELQNVGKFMIDLRGQGNDLNRVLEKMTQALVEGNVGALAEFGVVMRESTGTAEAFKAIMDRAADSAAGGGDKVALATDQMTRAGVAFADASRDISVAIGEITVALSPLIEGLAGVIGGFNALSGMSGKSTKGMTKSMQLAYRAVQLGVNTDQGRHFSQLAIQAAQEAEMAELERVMAEGDRRIANQDMWRMLGFDSEKAAGIMSGKVKFKAKGKKKRGGGTVSPALMSDEERMMMMAMAGAVGGAQIGDIAGSIGSGGDPGSLSFSGTQGTGSHVLNAGELAAHQQLMMERAEAKGTLLEAVFGGPSEFDSYIMLMEGMTDVTNTMATAVQAAGEQAFTAWITGQKGIKEAAKEAAAGVLLAKGAEAAGMAALEGAYALAALATGRLAEAAGHGAAAAKFGATALLMGGLARGLGAGSSGSASAGAGGYSGAGAPGGGGGGDQSITIIAGPGMEGMSAQERRARFASSINEANRELGSRNKTVVYE